MTKREKERINNTIHNMFLTWVTVLAVTFNVLAFVIAVWCENAKEIATPVMYIIWALSLVWILVFVYANAFHKKNR